MTANSRVSGEGSQTPKKGFLVPKESPGFFPGAFDLRALSAWQPSGTGSP